jgi:RHS repeat-associated protein
MDPMWNYAVPMQTTTSNTGLPSLSSNLTWNQALGLTGGTGPNGDTVTLGYDGASRPMTSKSPYGATTTYTYNDGATPPNQVATINGRYVRTSMDGFGRTIRTTNGSGTTDNSSVDTVYAACGCSPLGKVTQVSQPYAAGGSASKWTSYTYDGIGRTTAVSVVDGSTTRYVYAGNTVKVTDPAGSWKKYTMDAFGNVTTVEEPNPLSAGGSLFTYYTYDIMNHLTGVSMTRGGAPQTRTFKYTLGTTNTVSGLLQSSTNPETGTIQYTYDPKFRLLTKTDANNTVFTYNYDLYNRLVSVMAGGNTLRTLTYDGDSTGFSQYSMGRLTSVQNNSQFTEMYSYTQPGGVAVKRLQVNQNVQYTPPSGTAQNPTVLTLNFDVGYGYDAEGRVTTVSYPASTLCAGTYGCTGGPMAGPVYQSTYDTLGRLSTMSGPGGNVGGVTYGPANQLLTMTYNLVTESRTYNDFLQVTSITGGPVNLTYAYPAGANNGKICGQFDGVTGEQVVYAYDSLNRLLSASGNVPSGGPGNICTASSGTSPWGQSYTYDGFGNLTDKNITAGAATPLHVTVDSATNRLGLPSLVGVSPYDANGNLVAMGTGPTQVNMTYDLENRMTGYSDSRISVSYGYDSRNRRVYKSGNTDSQGNATGYTVYIYGLNGRRLATYTVGVGYYPLGNISAPYLTAGIAATDVYFGGKRLAPEDRLGSGYSGTGQSHNTYFPYGEDRGGTMANDQVKFATYTRDSAGGLDYADQRYYSSALGRFMSPAPYRRSARETYPQSWNQYQYALGDPINNTDSTGLVSDPDGSGGEDCWFDEDIGYSVCSITVTSGGNDNLLTYVSTPSGTYTSTGSGGSGYNAAGLAKAVQGLYSLARLSFDGNCAKDLNALNAYIAKNGTDGPAAYNVPIDRNSIVAAAGQTLTSGTLYDGGSSPTKWSNTDFGNSFLDMSGQETPSDWTVGQDFMKSGNLALSQGNGTAIWVNTASLAQNYGSAAIAGLLIHEIIHKFGLGDYSVAKALGVTIVGGQTSVLTTRLTNDCAH